MLSPEADVLHQTHGKGFPSMSIPTSGAVVGSSVQTTIVTTTGKRSSLKLAYRTNVCILIARSFFVVNNFIIGGWMIGTNAMYEYAATAIGPIRPV